MAMWRSAGTVSIIAVAGGLPLALAGVPAGALLGSIAAVGAYNLWTDGAARVPAAFRDASRILVGTVIGSLATPGLLAALGASVHWALLFTALLVLIGLGCGLLLARLAGLELRTALLACSPGGMPEMTALAEDVGARIDVVVAVHLVRKFFALVAIVLVAAMVQ
jgi:membrane AbrB-like protein